MVKDSKIYKGKQLISLQQKKDYLEFLEIERFQLNFGSKAKYKWPVREIKFSNDWKFAFVCNNKIGNYNEDNNTCMKYEARGNSK